MAEEQIILRPAADLHEQAFTDKKIVHQLELRQVLALIDQFTDEVKQETLSKTKAEPTIDNRRVHHTITLSGSRGSGKTSFLKTLTAEIKSKPQYKIEILEIVDPTLTEEKGHIFLNIVARVKERIDALVDKKNQDKETSFRQSAEYKQWEESLNSLAAGLPMLDGINGGLDPSDWNDTTFVMRDGLRRVSGANRLEEYFRKYITYSLQLLEKRFLLIAFDDVDTDFAKGWPVLETLRKYLTAPNILTFISGDLDLYSFLVRKKQWKNFGKALLKNEYDKPENIYAAKYPELVEQLESQYMMKLLKPEYRITLSTLASKLATKRIQIYIDSVDADNELGKYYSKQLEDIWGISGNTTQLSYVRFFTSLPLRTQLSLLQLFSPAQDQEQDLRIKLQNLAKGISDVFYNELRYTKVDIWGLLNEYGLANIYLLRFLLDNNVLDEASQFFPKLNNPSLDGAVVALGAVLSEKLTLDPYELFDHIVRVSNVVTKATRWPMAGASPNIQDFVQHSRSLFDYGLKKIASLQSAYIMSFDDEDAAHNGLIPLRSLQSRSKEGRDENDLALDEVFNRNNESEIVRLLGLLPAFGAQDPLGRNRLFYSFYNLIGAIGEIIQNENEQDMQNELIRLAQLREFPMAHNQNNRDDITDDAGAYDDLVYVDKDNTIGEFVSLIRQWKERYNCKKNVLPPYLLGRIMVRTAYSFMRIHPQSDQKVAELFHRLLLVFLNAVLVEEVMERDATTHMTLANPTGSDKIFGDNYNKIYSSRETTASYPLFEFMLACPFIQAYLDPNLLEQIEIQPAYSVYNDLQRLNILGVSEIKKTIKLDARVRADNQGHIDALIQYFQHEGLIKDQLDFEQIKRAIKKIFKNKMVYDRVVTDVLRAVKNSNKW